MQHPARAPHPRFWFILLFIALQAVAGAAAAFAGSLSQQDLLQRIETGTAPLILDVRTPKEFAESHVPGAINIPHTELRARMSEVRASGKNEIVVYCESGRRAAIAQDLLSQAGIGGVSHLEGDMAAWRKQGLPQE